MDDDIEAGVDQPKANPRPTKDEESFNKNVFSDTDRQLFNMACSVRQFYEEARKDEASSSKARARCRMLLESGMTKEAREAARRALEARGRSVAYSEVSKRINWIVKKLNEEECEKPEAIDKALEMLDAAIFSNDVWDAKKITEVILAEFEKVIAPEIQEETTEKEINQYLKRLKEEIAVLNRLKYERYRDNVGLSDFDVSQSSGVERSESSIVSSAGRLRSATAHPRTNKIQMKVNLTKDPRNYFK